MRPYFVTPKQLACYLSIDDVDMIRDMCAKGELGPCIKVRNHWRIPIVELRKKYPISVEFWQEVVEDYYRGLNGPESAKMRLERRKEGKNPSTGEKVQKAI